jgi:hypothetical protein
VLAGAHTAFRFKEQTLMFDFNVKMEVSMQVETLKHKGEYHRYDRREQAQQNKYGNGITYKERGPNQYQNSVPNWMNCKIEAPMFSPTDNLNNVLALFHYNQEDCQILPATKIVDFKKCKMDIDRNLYFLKIPCSDIEEAKKRALVLAYL